MRMSLTAAPWAVRAASSSCYKIIVTEKLLTLNYAEAHDYPAGRADRLAPPGVRDPPGRGAAGAQEAPDASAAVRHGDPDVPGAGLRRRSRGGDRRGVRGVGEDGLQLLPHQGVADPGPPGGHRGLAADRPGRARGLPGRG